MFSENPHQLLGSAKSVRLWSNAQVSLWMSAVVVALLLVSFPLAGYADPLVPGPAGSWAAYPNSTLRHAMGSTTGNPRFLFDNSGGWFDEDRIELGVWGGGNDDYPGNEVCTFALLTGVWTCGPRSPAAVNLTAETAPDGRPSERRTYSCVARVNVPGYDGFFCHGGSLMPGSRATAATWFYHRDTATWERLQDRPNWGVSDSAKASPATSAIFDKARSRVLVRAKNMCLIFDMRTKAWEWGAACSGIEKTASATFDPERQTLIVMGGGSFEAWDTSTTAWTPLAAVLVGDQAAVAAKGPGLVFDPVGKRFLAYIGGKDLYELNRDTWTFTKITGAGADPGAQYATGTHGRLDYVPSTNGLVVVNSTDSSVFYFQLGATAPGGGSPPPPTGSMPTLTIMVGVPACALTTSPCLKVELKQVVLP